jgi:hypothetical protein
MRRKISLPGQEDEWRKDPMYELNRQYEESIRIVEKTLGEPLSLGAWKK